MKKITEPPYIRTTFREFLVQVYGLSSFKLFLIYLSVIYLSRYWKRVSQPWNVRKIMVIYNFAMSLFNLYTFLRFLSHILHSEHLFSRKYDAGLVHTLYLYWLTKILELSDTAFMIVRHKSRQISFLHVFHHSTMIILTEYGYKLTPRTSLAAFLSLNAFVHVCLYLYYGLAALNPNNPPKWKKLLTQAQILQFCIQVSLGLYGYFYHTFCIYGILYGLSMLYLFSKFYYKTYIKVKNE